MAKGDGVTPIRSHSLREHEQHRECSRKKRRNQMPFHPAYSRCVNEGARDTSASFLRANQCLRWLIFFPFGPQRWQNYAWRPGKCVQQRAYTVSLPMYAENSSGKKYPRCGIEDESRIVCKTLNGGLLHLARQFTGDRISLSRDTSVASNFQANCLNN